jgi:hypothetical protein
MRSASAAQTDVAVFSYGLMSCTSVAQRAGIVSLLKRLCFARTGIHPGSVRGRLSLEKT